MGAEQIWLSPQPVNKPQQAGTFSRVVVVVEHENNVPPASFVSFSSLSPPSFSTTSGLWRDHLFRLRCRLCRACGSLDKHFLSQSLDHHTPPRGTEIRQVFRMIGGIHILWMEMKMRRAHRDAPQPTRFTPWTMWWPRETEVDLKPHQPQTPPRIDCVHCSLVLPAQRHLRRDIEEPAQLLLERPQRNLDQSGWRTQNTTWTFHTNQRPQDIHFLLLSTLR